MMKMIAIFYFLFTIITTYTLPTYSSDFYATFVSEQGSVKRFEDPELNALTEKMIDSLVTGDCDLIFEIGLSLSISLRALLPVESHRREFLDKYVSFVMLNSRQPVVIKSIEGNIISNMLQDLPNKSLDDIKIAIREMGETPETVLINKNKDMLNPPANNATTWHVDGDESEPYYILFAYDDRLTTEYVTHPVPMLVIDEDGAKELWGKLAQDSRLNTFTEKAIIFMFRYSHVDHVFRTIYPKLDIKWTNFVSNTIVSFPADLVHRTPQKRCLQGINHYRVLCFISQK